MRRCVIKVLSWKHSRRSAIEGPLSKECLWWAYLLVIYTVWPEILAGNLFWWIGGFESNQPIFHLPKTSKCDVIIIAKS